VKPGRPIEGGCGSTNKQGFPSSFCHADSLFGFSTLRIHVWPAPSFADWLARHLSRDLVHTARSRNRSRTSRWQERRFGARRAGCGPAGAVLWSTRQLAGNTPKYIRVRCIDTKRCPSSKARRATFADTDSVRCSFVDVSTRTVMRPQALCASQVRLPTDRNILTVLLRHRSRSAQTVRPFAISAL